jgi:GGDEF domain-containing protein
MASILRVDLLEEEASAAQRFFAVLARLLDRLKGEDGPNLEGALQDMGELTGAYSAVLFLLEDDAHGHRICVDHGAWWDGHCPVHAHNLFAHTAFPLSDYPYLTDMVFNDKLLTCVTSDLPSREYGLFSALGAGGLAILPLFADGDALGFIALFYRDGHRQWALKELAALRGLAALLSHALAARKGRQAQREAAERMKLLAQGGYDWVIGFDSTGRVSHFWRNPKVPAIQECRQGTGAALGEVLPHDMAQTLLRAGPRVLADSEPVQIELSHGGSPPRHFTARLLSLPCSRRQCRDVLALIREVSRERSLQVQSEVMLAGLDLLREGVLKLNQAGGLAGANRAALAFLGHECSPLAEVLDRPLLDFVHPLDVPMVQDALADLLGGRHGLHTLRFRLIRGGEESGWVEGRFCAKGGPTSVPMGVVAVLSDVSGLYESSGPTLPLYDPLTRLPGQALFRSHLDQAMARARRGGGGLSVAAIRCQQVAELVAHVGQRSAGRLLQHVTERIGRVLRASDFLARWEADRLLLLLPDCRQGWLAVAGRLEQACASAVEIDGIIVHPRLVLRAAIYPEQATSEEELLRLVLDEREAVQVD